MAQNKRDFIYKLLDKIKSRRKDHKSMIIQTDVAQIFLERHHTFCTSAESDRYTIVIDYYENGERIKHLDKSRKFVLDCLSRFNIKEINI
jgi:hypothetical protein